jgi:hypothetical protein
MKLYRATFALLLGIGVSRVLPAQTKPMEPPSRRQVDDDMAHKAAYWKPSWGMMVKDGNRGSDFVLIRVQPSRLEVSSVARGIFNDPVTWRPAIVELP